MNLVADFVTPERLSLVVRVVLMLAIGLPVIGFIKKILARMIKDRLSLQAEVLLVRTVTYVFYLILAVMVLNEFGFKISALLGAAGVFGVAIGFASQTSVSNIISGIFLISEKPFVIGDAVEIGGTLGIVDSIDLLSIKMKTFDNRYVRIPNETMIKSEVINLTRFDIRRAQIVVGVAYKEDVRKVLDVLRDIAANISGAMTDPEPLIQVDSFGDSSININFGVWTQTSNAVNMKTELIIAVKERFDKEGIEIPFPHVSLYAGEISKPIMVQSTT
ncbi:MAG: mechanosensitive ion channel family protein [Candidatus Cloacimonetes bacterium]|nr:mechanosensitive ion channel family protein [Candidatus Cloacimonadota bacterium]MDY0337999.1 mechanosensitive ion channel family protein [Candidatus Cloacimonadaceae bacterium]MDD2543147.1 mechanosensitive ion channel family protein [Candidatus Cloacimonadota bacterium]MDD2683619.1 mechanosensitive ion channel family protein [Candidatus Cloacimonadota bacterium]MDD3097879.1 mechanosensitive ion channel family protein [Candidatus Cloacimonadota bacterium]